MAKSQTTEGWEAVARSAARALPLSDYGSTRAIQDVARLLAAAYQRGLSDGAAPSESDVLRGVVLDIGGIWGAFEHRLREVMGNANYGLAAQRLDDARAALAKASGEG